MAPWMVPAVTTHQTVMAALAVEDTGLVTAAACRPCWIARRPRRLPNAEVLGFLPRPVGLGGARRQASRRARSRHPRRAPCLKAFRAGARSAPWRPWTAYYCTSNARVRVRTADGITTWAAGCEQGAGEGGGVTLLDAITRTTFITELVALTTRFTELPCPLLRGHRHRQRLLRSALVQSTCDADRSRLVRFKLLCLIS